MGTHGKSSTTAMLAFTLARPSQGALVRDRRRPGLLPAERTPAGYRLYSEDAVIEC
ncbi:hypothetical protein [Streptomyces cyaneofuscatus]|uniref:hypothetical protein n=1 Tax=Streptomyces cyaneofuscatus TaxID=66883 RepID=UPI0036B9682E